MKLSKDEALVLLKRLASDDGFRAQIVTSPEKALAELGIAADAAAGFVDSSRVRTCSLASKQAFADLHASLSKGGNTVQMDMTVPQLKLD